MDEQPNPKARSNADWEQIEREYRAGVLSLRVIAKQNAISETAIRKRAKKEAWERDLSARVDAQVRSELVRAEVRNAHNANPETEREIIESAAAQVVTVVREHRKDIAAGRKVAAKLMEQLAELAEDRDSLDAAVAEEPDPNVRAKIRKALALPTHAATIRDLATAMKGLVALERQAFSIADAPVEAPAAPAGLTIKVDADEGFIALRAAFAKRLAGAAGQTGRHGTNDDGDDATP